jgi:hypothetical protein
MRAGCWKQLQPAKNENYTVLRRIRTLAVRGKCLCWLPSAVWFSVGSQPRPVYT